MKSHIPAAILLTSVCISVAPSDPNPRLSQPTEKWIHMYHESVMCIHMKRKTQEKETLTACIFLCHKCTCSMSNSNSKTCLPTDFCRATEQASILPNSSTFFSSPQPCPSLSFSCPQRGLCGGQTLPAELWCCGHCCPKWQWGHLLLPRACVRTSSFPRL